MIDGLYDEMRNRKGRNALALTTFERAERRARKERIEEM